MAPDAVVCVVECADELQPLAVAQASPVPLAVAQASPVPLALASARNLLAAAKLIDDLGIETERTGT